MSAVRNLGVSRIILHRLLLAIGRPSVHPFGSPRAVEYLVHYACAHFFAEAMSTWLCLVHNTRMHNTRRLTYAHN
jgi:hypothetical protein